MKAIFKNTVLFSLLGHLTVFSLFSFSFGNKIPKADYAPVVFWGAVLRSADLMPRRDAVLKIKNPEFSSPAKVTKESPVISNIYLKPAINLAVSTQKLSFAPGPVAPLASGVRPEAVIMLYPQLPQNFLLYFQDRQVVHIELVFDIISGGKANSVTIKRKISSGNLDADLLTMRYISHYLFIQQAAFPQDSWQTVKIDLSTKQ